VLQELVARHEACIVEIERVEEKGLWWHQSVGMNFCDKLWAARKGIASVGKISRSNFFYFFKDM